MDLEQILTDESSPRLGTSPEALARGIVENLFFVQGRLPENASAKAWFEALAVTLRHRVMPKWANSLEARREPSVRQVAYLSAEFLLGPHAGSVIQALDLGDEIAGACELLGIDLDAVLAEEPEPGLGNGGLGRLAACYMDSLSALDYPAMGYGIRYEHGIFVQAIEGGRQVELPDNWLSRGNPWEVRRAGLSYDVGFGGRTERVRDGRGRVHVQWIPEQVVKGVAHDTPMVGYKVDTVNTLRLWRSESPESFDLDAFNKGDYDGSVAAQTDSETISKVLYPNDEGDLGKVLRLKQQYFFTSCA
ncbi:MAG: glycogen phosphorylase, partial [Acidimicrobiia bacterium]|nr:glycogen phosphorylase [Acidimicrobiia bacterium]